MGSALCATLVFICTSCASIQLPDNSRLDVQNQDDSAQAPAPAIDGPIEDLPPLPFDDPNILGRNRLPIPQSPPDQSLDDDAPSGPPPALPELTRQSALACLATGRPVYGIALANTNVRTGAAIDSCRIGRAPRGTLLRVDALFEQGTLSKLNSLRRPTPDVEESPPAEDVPSQERESSSSSSTESLVLAFQAVTASNKSQGSDSSDAGNSDVGISNNDNSNVGNNTSNSGSSVGYDEDILPIFERSCNACHSEVARTKGLVVTDYEQLLKGSDSGTMLVPGSLDGSMLWWQVYTNKMPVIGELSDDDKALIKRWIEEGAPERRGQTSVALADLPGSESRQRNNQQEATSAATTEAATGSDARAEIENIWLQLNADDFDSVPNSCEYDESQPHTLASGGLVQLLSCGVEPDEDMLARIRTSLQPVAAPITVAPAPSASTATVAQPASAVGSFAGITAAPLGVGPPLDSDVFMVPKANFCLEPRYMKLQDKKSITAMAFAPDGRLFMAIDDMPTGQKVDPLILLDANHPSRYIAVIDSNTGGGYVELVTEKGRITGLDYFNGALYVSLAGEVGVIPDGQKYKTLAGGFAVASQYFHANNGIVVSDGWVYVSTGGIRDGWSDGPIVGMDESGAMHVVSGGNPWASRIVRAPLDVLLRDRSINNFQTASRGWRNPYGLARGPDGRLWVTDNGATNVPDGTSAGDEVNVFDPRAVAPGTPDGETPFFGFPLALSSGNPGWYTEPVIQLPNAGAPTGITWAYGTIFYGQYGTKPGLYRLAASGGGTITERVMMGWPIVSLATAPDGSLWIGMGTGGVYRLGQC